MFSFGVMLALAMLITCLNGQETPIAQCNCNDLIKKLEDMECRVKQMETMFDKFVGISMSWKKEPTLCIPPLPSGETASSSLHDEPSRPKSRHVLTSEVGNFSFAKRQCKEYQGHLVFIDSLEESKKLTDYLKQEVPSELCWWIGLNDEDKDGIWTWVGTKSQTTFKSWGTNQPGNNGQCAVMNSKSGYDWYSESCSFYKCNAVCEVDFVR